MTHLRPRGNFVPNLKKAEAALDLVDPTTASGGNVTSNSSGNWKSSRTLPTRFAEKHLNSCWKCARFQNGAMLLWRRKSS